MNKYWILFLVLASGCNQPIAPPVVVKPTPTPTVTPTQKPTPTPTPSATPTPGQTLRVSVAPFDKPDAATSTAGVMKIALSRNEVVGQFVKFASCTVPTATPPVGVKVEFFTLGVIKTVKPSFIGARVGDHYDAVIPSDGKCISGWAFVDISVDKTVKPGKYAFKILDLPVDMTVYNLTMPDRPSVPLYIGLGSFGAMVKHGYSKDSSVSVQDGVVQKYISLFRNHRIEPFGQRNADPGPNSSGLIDMDQWPVGSFRQTNLIGAIADPSIMFGPFAGESWPKVETLKAWEKTIKADSKLAGAWAYITDEPCDSPNCGNNYDPNLAGTLARAKLFRTNAPSMKIMLTHEPDARLIGFIDYFVSAFEQYKVAGHWQDYSKAPNYWIYGACMSHGSCANGYLGNNSGTPDLMLDQPTIHARMFPVVAAALGAKASLYYNSIEAYGQTDPWNDQYLFGGNGDGTLVYPGIKGQRGFTEDKAIGSIRFKMLRQGMFDLEYLKLAKNQTVVKDQFSWTKNHSDVGVMRDSVGVGR